MRASFVRSSLATLLLAAGLAACASASVPAPQRRGTTDLSVITAEQMAQYEFRTAQDAVLLLRRQWLADRPPDRLEGSTELLVYLDEARMGGVGALRNIPIAGVLSIRYLRGIEAHARYGEGHDRGVILVTTKRETLKDP